MSDNSAIEKKLGFWSSLLFVVYLLLSFKLLRWFLTDVVQLSRPDAFSFAICVTLLIAYPLFVKRTTNLWTKDNRPWTFLAWGVCSSTISMFVYLVVLYSF